MATEVTRYISTRTSSLLWGRSAGRCQFDGCNRPLWKSLVTQERMNAAERAHIYSYGDDGPRGHEGLDESTLNDHENLMLVCHQCHELIDQDRHGKKYSAGLLLGWKRAHEARMELVTGIIPNKRSNVVLYGANIGQHSAPLSREATLPALFPSKYPASDVPIELGMHNSSWRDRDPEFWRLEDVNLIRQYESKVQAALATGDVSHLSVFGLAPQPLLIRLGTLLTDIVDVDVYPLLREPKGWGWDDTAAELDYCVTPPSGRGAPALVLSLSGTIVPERVERALGSPVSVWHVSLAQPHNDALRSRQHGRKLRETLRKLLDEIKAAHEGQPLSIFPAMSVAAAVELGRVRMPKADMPWRIYDEVSALGGFVQALEIR